MKRFFFIAAAVLGFAACEPAQEEVIWPELEMSFAQKNYTMVLDSEQEIEYTVTGIQGAEVEVIATLANTEDWSVESQFNSETGKGVLTVTAPAKASVTTLTVEVKDAKNNRTVSTTFALASTPEGLPAITVAFTGESHAITAGEGTLALEFEVTGLGNATLVDPVEADVTTNLNVVSVTWNSETAKGVVTLSAPINAVTGQENVSIKVKDTYAREAIDVAEVAVSGLSPISAAFTGQTYSVTAGEGTLALEFEVTGLGSATLVDPVRADVTTDLTVESVSWDAQTAKGVVTVSAVETAAAGNVALTIKVKDSYDREAVANAEVTVVVPVPTETPYNCYIVKPGESIQFTSKYSSIVSVELAWQDAPTLIKSLSVENKQVKVETNAVAGNALVKGLNAEGTTLWSWHIWVTDFDPDATAVTVNGVTFMDRNLGAVSAERSGLDAIGHAYQWGRKDPMPRITTRDPGTNGKGTGSCEIYDINGASINSMNGDLFYMFKAATSMEDSYAYPEYFFERRAETNAWFTPSGSFVDSVPTDDSYKDFWGGVSDTKTVNDPCPEGWRVPTIKNGVNPYAFMTEATYDGTNRGFLYSKDGKELWFPMTGQRSRSKGAVHNPTQDGNYWLASYCLTEPATSKGYKYIICDYLQLNYDGTLSFSETKTSRPAYTSTALAVRCVKE